ncbi:MAG: MotA/TolQ/ExbB proton channel family protein [Candidatus Cloacimonetes bacterium]|nr:MotA/TolQ/ExbB proton channel family protein [Candidatus Cloacimonadota bacterium]
MIKQLVFDPISISLIALSIIGVGVILERLFFWGAYAIRSNKKSRLLLIEYLQKKDSKSLLALVEGSSDDWIKTVKLGFKDKDTSICNFDYHDTKFNHMIFAGISVLDTIASIAPMLGILGTVIGIIFSFQGLSVQSADSMMLVSQGIAQALQTTAIGLVVAMIMTVPSNYFFHKANKIQYEKNRYFELISKYLGETNEPSTN